MVELVEGSLDRLRTIGAIALDMDGTTYLGDRLLPGAAELIETLGGRGIPFVFLTNNSSKTRAEYAAKLAHLGLPVGEDRILTSGDATWAWLLRERPGARVFLLAPPAVEAEAKVAGIRLECDSGGADTVVLAFDTTLTFARLSALCALVRRGLPFIATHPDRNCPVEGGYIPDVGSILACVETSTGRRPDVVIGKPNPPMVAALTGRLGLPPERIAYVGDRLYTDVAMARATGMLSVLVLTGETSRGDIDGAEFMPDVVASGLAEVNEFLSMDGPPRNR